MNQAEEVERVPGLEFDVWWGLAAGPLSWGINEGTDYAITSHACSSGHFYVLHVTSLICLLLALSGFVLAFVVHRKLPHDPEREEQLPRDRAYFLSMVGMGMSLAFGLIVLAQTIPQWILSPCS